MWFRRVLVGVGLVCCSVYKKSYIIYNTMSSKENMGLSSEGGGPAHNSAIIHPEVQRLESARV